MSAKSRMVEFPSSDEYPEYAEMYMKWVLRDGSLIEQLEKCTVDTLGLIGELSEEELNFSYAEGKWTIKEILVHVIDDERIYAYRALSIARNDSTNLPGFDPDAYVAHADIHDRPINSLIEEYNAVRLSTIALFKGLSDTALHRTGIANGNKASARALGYHILGHELHHVQLIKDIYLPSLHKARNRQ